MDKQTADDLHLIASPFRFIRDLFQTLAIILVLPVVFVINLVKWGFTGEPIMTPDEIILFKYIIIFTTPIWIPMCCVLIRRHSRSVERNRIEQENQRKKETEYKNRITEKNLSDLVKLDTLPKTVCAYCQAVVPKINMAGLTMDRDWASVGEYHGSDCPWIKGKGRPYLVS